MAWEAGDLDVTIQQPLLSQHLERFRQKIADNATGWLCFIRQHTHDVSTLDVEFANLTKAISQALLEPLAYAAGLDLVVALWPFVELRGRWLGWESVLQEALVVCRDLERAEVEAQLLDQLGELARIVGDSERALLWQEQSLHAYRRLEDQPRVGQILNHLSMQHLALGNYTSAAQCSQEAVETFAQTGERTDLAAALNNLGLIYQQSGQWELANRQHAEAAALFEASGDSRGQAKAIHNQGEVYRHSRRPDEATDCFRRATALLTSIGDEINAARSRVSLSIVLHGLGQTGQALAICLLPTSFRATIYGSSVRW
jgi:tetratricopeptide (TPR) repeat protein